jgi:tetrahydrodipicolinate N-succinyltransferase
MHLLVYGRGRLGAAIAALLEGVLVRAGAVIGAGVVLTAPRGSTISSAAS